MNKEYQKILNLLDTTSDNVPIERNQEVYGIIIEMNQIVV